MKSRAFYRKDQFYIKVKMTDDVWSDMDDEMLNKVDEFEKHLSDKAWEMFTSFLNLPVSSLKAEIIDELDFKSLGCVLEVMPCPFYGTKNIYTLKGNYDSEKGTMDGFDTDYVIKKPKMITKKQFKDALELIANYEQQLRQTHVTSSATHQIGCRVKLSKWGHEMQGKSAKAGTVVDFFEGAVNRITDGTVCVKWDGEAKPSWMHISQIEPLK